MCALKMIVETDRNLVRRQNIANSGRNAITLQWTGLSGPPAHVRRNYCIGLLNLVRFTSRQLAVDLRTRNGIS